MPRSAKNIFLLLVTIAILVLPAIYAIQSASNRRPEQPVQTLSSYLHFLYARDFRRAYRFIATEDQRVKPLHDYLRERPPFTGFTLDVARRLAALIEIRPLSEAPEQNVNRVKVNLKLPDANALSGLLLDWDESRLNALPAAEQKKILAAIDEMTRQGKLPMIEGEEQFTLLREGSQWRVSLDWGAGVKVSFTTVLPSDTAISAEPLAKQTVARPSDVFTIGFRVKNRSNRAIVTRIVHRVEPKDLAQYLELVQCALLLPVQLRPGEEQTYNSTYVVRGDLPDGAERLDVIYEFKIDN
ncbi:MAG TPA: cytochrome c oxidase assembly protein [Candidatus Binatia bacterium]